MKQFSSYTPSNRLYEAAAAVLAGEDKDHEKLKAALLEAEQAIKDRADNAAAIQAAREQYCDDDLEIDDLPHVSQSDDGVWVSAWVFVRASDED